MILLILYTYTVFSVVSCHVRIRIRILKGKTIFMRNEQKSGINFSIKVDVSLMPF